MSQFTEGQRKAILPTGGRRNGSAHWRETDHRAFSQRPSRHVRGARLHLWRSWVRSGSCKRKKKEALTSHTERKVVEEHDTAMSSICCHPEGCFQCTFGGQNSSRVELRVMEDMIHEGGTWALTSAFPCDGQLTTTTTCTPGFFFLPFFRSRTLCKADVMCVRAVRSKSMRRNRWAGYQCAPQGPELTDATQAFGPERQVRLTPGTEASS